MVKGQSERSYSSVGDEWPTASQDPRISPPRGRFRLHRRAFRKVVIPHKGLEGTLSRSSPITRISLFYF